MFRVRSTKANFALRGNPVTNKFITYPKISSETREHHFISDFCDNAHALILIIIINIYEKRKVFTDHALQWPNFTNHAPIRSPQLRQPSRRQCLLGPPSTISSFASNTNHALITTKPSPHPLRRASLRLTPKHPPLPYHLLAPHHTLAHAPHHRQPRIQAPASSLRALQRQRPRFPI